MSHAAKNVVDVFGGAENVVSLVVRTVAALCRIRGWDARILAAKAFPATAQRAAETGVSSDVRQEFERIMGVAQGLISEQAKRLPPQRLVLAFLDALGAPLQRVLASRNLSEDEKNYWTASLKDRGMAAVSSSTGNLPPAPGAGDLELLLALDALASVCEPEPPPSAAEVERRKSTRAAVRTILGMSPTG